jgi:hypothetical protein
MNVYHIFFQTFCKPVLSNLSVTMIKRVSRGGELHRKWLYDSDVLESVIRTQRNNFSFKRLAAQRQMHPDSELRDRHLAIFFRKP